MNSRIKLLDCTLRDGAYVNDSQFGVPALKGIIKKMQDARVEIIECGWLKNDTHKIGSSYFHLPQDLEPYLLEKDSRCTYAVMIDWDRYDTSVLPQYDGKSIDAVRIVFPRGKHIQGIEVGKQIRAKGYRVYFQLANTLAYSDEELAEVAGCMNEFMPESVSVVDTFGAMYAEDVERILKVVDAKLDKKVKLGFHSHNNQQLAFANSMRFVDLLQDSPREVVLDASLCGMGRGAGNATTELVANYLNLKHSGNYDMNAIMDAIDMYMESFKANYTWGYSTPYFIAGMYQCHVNNIAYLLQNHRTNSRDMRNIIDSLTAEQRRKYDYDLLENRYIENQNRLVDDEAARTLLKAKLRERKVLLLAPGKSINEQQERIKRYIAENDPVVIGVNAINTSYQYDYLFFVNSVRYQYAKEAYAEQFAGTKRIVLSNVKTQPGEDELVVNFNGVIKRGWPHFDNAVICCLRLMNVLDAADVVLAGFDGFKTKYNESYCDAALPSLNVEGKWDELNDEIKDMFADVKRAIGHKMRIIFLTDSIFNEPDNL